MKYFDYIGNIGLENSNYDDLINQKLYLSNLVSFIGIFVIIANITFRLSSGAEFNYILHNLLLLIFVMPILILKNVKLKLYLSSIFYGFIFTTIIVATSINTKLSMNVDINIANYIHPIITLFGSLCLTLLLIPISKKKLFYSAVIFNFVAFTSQNLIYRIFRVRPQDRGIYEEGYYVIVFISILIYLLIGFTVIIVLSKNHEYFSKLKLQKEKLEKQYKINLEQAEKLKDTNYELETLVNDLTYSKAKLNSIILSKDNFISMLSHDLKNQIFGITLSIETILSSRDKFTGDELEVRIASLLSQSQLVNQLLDNLLQWSRNELGETDISLFETNVDELVENAISNLKKQIELKEIKIIKKFKHKSNIVVDANLIEAALRIVISNAIKYSHKSNFIEINTFENEDKITFIVSDKGIGIDDSDAQRLFNFNEKFSRKGTENEKGTGLSLIICKNFIDLHDGHIFFESSKDVGTKFYIILPKNQKNTTSPKNQSSLNNISA